MEVWAGHAAATLEAARATGWNATEPVDLLYGTNLRKPSECAAVERDILRLEPDLLIMAPPCGPWCSWRVHELPPNPSMHAG